MNTLKVVSWNIAGGYPIASLEHFDYEQEDVKYFVDQVKFLSPDIICLQESHTSLDGSRSIAQEMADQLEMSFVFNSPSSPSHINDSYQLSTAIISSKNTIDAKVYWYPDPGMELFFADGRKAITHKKNLQIVSFDDLHIANNQLLPISLFGYKYDDGNKGSDFAEQIDLVMKNVQTPLIWCGDFNFDDPRSIYKTIQRLNLADALPDKATRPTKDGSKKNPDHIYYSSEFNLIRSDVIETRSDHYLCYAEFTYNGYSLPR